MTRVWQAVTELGDRKQWLVGVKFYLTNKNLKAEKLARTS